MYSLSNKDILSPAMVYVESFFLTTLVAMIYYDEWNTEYSIEFLLYVVASMLLFVIVSLLVKNGKNKSLFLCKLKPYLNKRQIKRIHISTITYIIFLILSLFTLYMYFKEVYRIAAALGNTNGIEGMYFVFHNKYLLSQGDSEIKISVVVNVLTRITVIYAYYFSYVFCNNVFRYGEKIRENLKYLIFPVLYMVQLFIGSQRTGVIYVLFAFILISYVMKKQNGNWKPSDKYTVKLIRYSLIAIIALAYGLRWTGELMGRTSDLDIFNYFSGYLGGGIPNFAHFIEQHDMKLLGNIPSVADASVFRRYSGVNCNLSTWLSDVGSMGILGFMAYIAAVSGAYSHIYYTHIYRRSKTVFSDYVLIIFAFAMQGILFVALTDIIVSHMLGVGYVFFCVGIWILDKYCRRRTI